MNIFDNWKLCLGLHCYSFIFMLMAGDFMFLGAVIAFYYLAWVNFDKE